MLRNYHINYMENGYISGIGGGGGGMLFST